LGAKISGKLIKPNTKGRTLKYFFAHEVWDFFERVMPAFINKDIVFEVYECKTQYPHPTIEIGTHLRKRLAKHQLRSETQAKEKRSKREVKSKSKKAGKQKA